MPEPVIIEGATLLAGDVREVLRGLEAESVQCCITSPPYWGLRAYGTEPQVWLNPNAPEGGWKAMSRCEHEWGETSARQDTRGLASSTLEGAPPGKHQRGTKHSAFCRRCGAWRGELGQEPTPALFVEHLVEVFREVRRVLRPDGTLWLNLGDSYAGGSREGIIRDRPDLPNPPAGWGVRDATTHRKTAVGDLKPKDLCEIPSDVVRALRADGWWLRSRIPWLKRNPMPESTQDRPTSAVEYVFLLTKAGRYYYDGEAGRMPGAGVSGGACFGKQPGRNSRFFQDRDPAHPTDRKQREDIHAAGAQSRTYDRPEYHTRARRNSDWFFESWQGLYADDDGAPLAFIVNPAAFKEAHFATFPPKLVEPMVKVGTSEKGCCPKCGKAWERVVETERHFESGSGKSGNRIEGKQPAVQGAGYGDVRMGPTIDSRTLGWRPGCECPEASSLEPQACVVLDPFSGAGTTAMVAVQLGRRAIGIDLSEKYNRMAAARIGKALNPATFVDEDAEADLPLLAQEGNRNT